MKTLIYLIPRKRYLILSVKGQNNRLIKHHYVFCQSQVKKELGSRWDPAGIPLGYKILVGSRRDIESQWDLNRDFSVNLGSHRDIESEWDIESRRDIKSQLGLCKADL